MARDSLTWTTSTSPTGLNPEVLGPMEYSRQYMIDLLQHAGLPQLAETAARELPDPVGSEQLEAWETQHGISRDDLISRFGGGP